MFTLQSMVLVQATAAWFLAGLIWVIQIVHYPLMNRVGESDWIDFEHAHMRRVTWIVAPAMLIEAASCGLCVLFVLGNSSGNAMPLSSMPMHLLLAALLVCIWLSTWLLQVPAHATLTKGFDARAHRSLVRTNWVRTAAWSARALILAWMIAA